MLSPLPAVESWARTLHSLLVHMSLALMQLHRLHLALGLKNAEAYDIVTIPVALQGQRKSELEMINCNILVASATKRFRQRTVEAQMRGS